MKGIQLLGCRGIPARHGGFETFAEHFAVYLCRKGWEVTVYCQENGSGEAYKNEWRGIKCVHIPVTSKKAIGTIIFDWKSTLCAVKLGHPVLTLGYNTAIFCIFYKLKGVGNVINMDGLEWRRAKWSPLVRLWLYANEKIGAWLGTHLIADHPEIKKHLAHTVSQEKISVIPYSADLLEAADESCLALFNLKKNRYAILIARPAQENSIFEIVKAYSSVCRKIPLIILGDYSPICDKYHKMVVSVAGDDVKFIGAIYEKVIVSALRFFSRFYVHGHTVGGTNPSLVEALGASSPVLAHDNKFNRWVAGEEGAALYFTSEEDCAQKISRLLKDDILIESMKEKSLLQFKRKFTSEKIYGMYEDILKSKMY